MLRICTCVGLLAALLVMSCTSANAQSTKTTKFGKGINYMAEDSSLSLKFHFRMQHLFIGSYDAATEEWSSNALVRRSRIKFDGFAVDSKLVYKVELGISNRDMSVNKESGQGRDAARLILDAVLKYQFSKNWQVWVGQTKLPGNRERVVSSANLQFVDRSNVNSKFNIDRDMGIQLHGKYTIGKMIVQPKFALANGEGRNITEGNHGGLNLTGHIDFLPFGGFEGKKQDYVLSDVTRQSKPKLAIGITYNQNQNAVRQQGQLGSFVTDSMGNFVENTLTLFVADVLFKYNGFSLLTEYASTEGAKNMDDISNGFMTGTGLNIQAGYLMKNNWEIAARYTTVAPDNSSFSGLTEQTEYTVGISRYIVGHKLKVQSDYGLIETVGISQPNYRMRLQVEMQF